MASLFLAFLSINLVHTFSFSSFRVNTAKVKSLVLKRSASLISDQITTCWPLQPEPVASEQHALMKRLGAPVCIVHRDMLQSHRAIADFCIYSWYGWRVFARCCRLTAQTRAQLLDQTAGEGTRVYVAGRSSTGSVYFPKRLLCLLSCVHRRALINENFPSVPPHGKTTVCWRCWRLASKDNSEVLILFLP